MLERAIDDALKENPKLQKKYGRPDPSSDTLYESDITHPENNPNNCAAICGDDPPRLILRRTRADYDDNPKVHHGLVALGNQLMMDASIRDLLAAEKNVLCFEMEAAGLMNRFPCLIIRGICDYSDTHKNKVWQGYAAVVVAAYAKHLLLEIPPSQVENERRLGELLSGAHDTLTIIGAKVDTLKSPSDHKADLEILNWLSTFDYGSQHSDNLEKRAPNTGQWLLASEEYHAWLTGDNATLFCPGIPGAGKTTLASILIEDLGKRREMNSNSIVGIAFIYFYHKRQSQQTLNELMASLLKQLAQGQFPLPQAVRALYERHQTQQTRPTLEKYIATLRYVIAMHTRVFVVIDALDECQVSDNCRARFLSKITELQQESGVNIFVTSRPLPEITRDLKDGISLDIRAHEEDVRRYLDSELLVIKRFLRGNLALQEEIKTGIIISVDGMFLLAKLYIDSLVDAMTPKAIRAKLRQFEIRAKANQHPYEDTYDDAMKRIKGQKAESREAATQVLLWITCVKRRLTIDELLEALAVEEDAPEIDPQSVMNIEDVLTVCAGLVIVDTESAIIRLVHHTAEEYFESRKTTLFPNCEDQILETCVTYLSFTAFEEGCCETNEEFEDRLEFYPFYDYSSHNWAHHARESKKLSSKVLDFVKSEGKVQAAVQSLWAFNGFRQPLRYSQVFPKGMNGLHLAACLGVGEIVTALLETYDTNTTDDYGGTPLLYAAANGHVAVLLLLVDGVDPDSALSPVHYWWSGRAPLSFAAENGHEEVVEILLERNDIDVNSGVIHKEGLEITCPTPLWHAAANGREAVVRRLPKAKGIDCNSKDPRALTALSLAADNGHENVVSLLLKADGINITSRDSQGSTALKIAIARGHYSLTESMLANVDISLRSTDTYSQTALLWAIDFGRLEAVKFLVSQG
ncbi:uncharacterized protein NECHADRAFT_55600, partial [Fusarium vanettenii 77-13-4]